MPPEDYIEQLERWAMSSGIRILLVIALALIGLWAARFLARRMYSVLKWRRDDSESQRRAETLSSFLRYAMAFAVFAIATMTILTELGLKIGPILAGAGIVGLAIGFGAQNLVQDVISGFFILVEDQIRVGDVIEVKGKNGVVERVGLRTTVLRDVSGNVHFLRNGQIDIVTNTSRGFSQHVFDVRVSYKADVDDVIRVLKEIDDELRHDSEWSEDLVKPLEIFGVDQLQENAVVIRARLTTKALRQLDVGREFNKRLKKKYDEQKVALAVRVM